MAGDDQAAEAHYAAGLRLCRQLGSRVEAQRLIHNLAFLALHRGMPERARVGFVESLAGFRDIGQQRSQAESIAGLACVAAQQADQAARRAPVGRRRCHAQTSARRSGQSTAPSAPATSLWPAPSSAMPPTR
jgi:hypothetical protein